jgi:hypothetical protein
MPTGSEPGGREEILTPAEADQLGDQEPPGRNA